MNTMRKFFKIICCDNAGKNKTLEENCAENFDEIKSEFTSPGTPQQNGVVERGFATIYSRMRLMVEYAVIHENLKTGLCPKCAATATKLENIMINPHKERFTHEKFYVKTSDYAKYLSTFVEMGVIHSIATVK